MEYDIAHCPVALTLDLIRGKWKPMILFLIQQDVNRFGLLKKQIPGISKKVLTEQLRDLEDRQLIYREVRVSTYPQEVFYSLTDGGTALRRLIDNIFDWGTEHLMETKTAKAINDIRLNAMRNKY